MQQPSATLRYGQARAVRYGWSSLYQLLVFFTSPSQPIPTPSAQETIHNARPSPSWMVDSTILSHMPCRHNVSGQLFTPSTQTRPWVRQSVFLYESEHFSMTPPDHDGVRGIGMTLSCRPGPDPEQIPVQESYCLFLTLATREQTKTAN